jgi:N-methylhydantoinase B
VVLTPGGAGIGDPRERAPTRVRDDVESGLVSCENAVAVYGFDR